MQVIFLQFLPLGFVITENLLIMSMQIVNLVSPNWHITLLANRDISSITTENQNIWFDEKLWLYTDRYSLSSSKTKMMQGGY